MNIIKIQGGLGNQLFQYAFYKELEYRGQEVYADLSQFKSPSEPRKYELPKLSVEVKEASEEMIAKYHFDNILLRKIYATGITKKKIIKEVHSQTFNPHFFEYDNAYLIGFWQSEKYFSEVKNTIKQSISFKNITNDNLKIISEMKKCNSVSVHLRFGDYVGNSLYDNICTTEYYLNAFDKIKTLEEGLKFFVISDDAERAKKVFAKEDCVYLDINRGEKSYLDMLLISSCKHHIMANSSFSWWGVFFAEDNGIVIAPKKWMNGKNTPDIWSDQWIRV